jgi:hypothetical protein
MKKFLLLSLFLVCFAGQGYTKNMTASFESYDLPGYYLGVVNEKVVLIELATEIDKEFTTFNIVPGIADRRFVSIQSATDPAYYFKSHKNHIILEEFSSWMIYKQSTTFIMDPGFADIQNPDLVSFRSWKYDATAIRHRGTEVLIEISRDNESFRRNATFIIRSPNWNGTNRLSKKRTGENSLSRSRTASLGGFIFFLGLVMCTVIFVLKNKEKTIKFPGLLHKGFRFFTYSRNRRVNSH